MNRGALAQPHTRSRLREKVFLKNSPTAHQRHTEERQPTIANIKTRQHQKRLQQFLPTASRKSS